MRRLRVIALGLLTLAGVRQASAQDSTAAQQDTSGKEFDLTQPNASAQAQEFVSQGNPTEEGGQLLASYAGVLQHMLSGG